MVYRRALESHQDTQQTGAVRRPGRQERMRSSRCGCREVTPGDNDCHTVPIEGAEMYLSPSWLHTHIVSC